MSDHAIVYDLQASGTGTFECTASVSAPCRAVWDCDCENIWNYKVIDGNPTHADRMDEWGDERHVERHIGRFDPEFCNLSDWYDGQEECVSGEVRVSIDPVIELDYVEFTATGARLTSDGEGDA